jgi:hypothetical protein
VANPPVAPVPPKKEEERKVSNVGVDFNLGYARDASQTSLSETISKISSKVQTVNEVNIGGKPPVDGNWKTWAESVRDSK